jgi:hypothetical protein
MKKKIIVLVVLSFFLLIPSSRVQAFTHVDNINDGIPVYFLVHLNSSQSIELNVTHISEGDFVLFLFDQRPTESFIELDNSLDPRIFTLAINYSLDDNPYILHTVSESRIYYIQLILLANGPDTFFLNSDRDLTRYYLPLIPGFQTEMILISIVLSIGFIILLKKNRKKV